MSVRVVPRLRTATWAIVLQATAYGSLPAQQELQTPAERSGFIEFTPYDSMWTFLGRVQAASTEMRLGVFGTTHAGRELPYAVFSRPSVTQPWEAWALGRPILVLAANVHGGERTLRESVLILVREFGTPGTSMNEALDDLTVLLVPQLNPDGFLTEPRPQRGNLWGLDLNRDYMKLEQPEIRAYVKNVLLPWAPHLFVDGHNGGSFPYNLNYQCPSHAAPDPRITELCDQLIFPAIEENLSAEGYRSWYYQTGNETRWDVGGSDPRIGRNYGGFANMVGILFEAPGGQELQDGVRSGLIGYRTVVEWARENSELLMQTVYDARMETLRFGAGPTGEIPIAVEYAPEPGPVTYLIGTGAGGREITEIVSDSLMKQPVATLTRPRPWAYLVPPDAEGAVELLQDHRIQVERLREPVTLDVLAYTITDITYETAYNHDAATRLETGGASEVEVSLPPGTYLVRTEQMQGRLAAHLLEPETTDGVVYWNRMDPWLPKREVAAYRAGDGEAPLFPIYKLMAPTALPTLMLPFDR